MNDEIERLRIERPDLESSFENALHAAEKMRLTLRKAFPALGAGHTDLYKAFAWRNWHLVRSSGGVLGVVLPRGALQTKGSEEWRKTVLDEGTFSLVTVLLNSGGWVFDDVRSSSYSVGSVLPPEGTKSRRHTRVQRTVLELGHVPRSPNGPTRADSDG